MEPIQPRARRRRTASTYIDRYIRVSTAEIVPDRIRRPAVPTFCADAIHKARSRLSRLLPRASPPVHRGSVPFGRWLQAADRAAALLQRPHAFCSADRKAVPAFQHRLVPPRLAQIRAIRETECCSFAHGTPILIVRRQHTPAESSQHSFLKAILAIVCLVLLEDPTHRGRIVHSDDVTEWKASADDRFFKMGFCPCLYRITP